MNKNKIQKFSTPPYIHNFAFTLAETLITLVIIGVVAALTVPMLIVKYQKEQTVTRLKKAYSALAQTTQRAIADYGPMKTWEVGEKNDENTKIFFDKYIAPYLSLLKSSQTKGEGNWNDEWNKLNGTENTYSDNTWVRAYLSDGSSLTFAIENNTDSDKRIQFNIDVNGDKKPNRFGKDIFQFKYYIVYDSNPSLEGKLVPAGALSIRRNILLEDRQYRCNKNREGYYCAALIMKDGWQIKDDYPW